MPNATLTIWKTNQAKKPRQFAGRRNLMLVNEDKRAFARLAIDCTVVFKEPERNTVLYGSGKNLSGNGILFETTESVTIGAELEIDVIPTLEQFKPLNAIAEVVRVSASDDKQQYLIAAALKRILS
jgi:hypothetical protein